jgi:hypothetical protein
LVLKGASLIIVVCPKFAVSCLKCMAEVPWLNYSEVTAIGDEKGVATRVYYADGPFPPSA